MKIVKEVFQKRTDELVRIEDSHDIEYAITVCEESIKQFGVCIPIVIDANNRIIAGNAVYEAAKKLSIEELPCVLFDGTEDEAREYRIADNKTAEFAKWDDKKLKQELSFLDSNLQDLQFCFDEDLYKMLGMVEENTARLMDEVQNINTESMSRPSAPATPTAPSQINSQPIHQERTNTIMPPEKSESDKQKDADFKKALKAMEKSNEVKPTEYFEYVCSKCGKKVVIRK